MPRLVPVLALGLALLGGAAVDAAKFKPMAWADLLSLPRPGAPLGRLRYGSGIAPYGDLWLPAGAGPHPLVVLILPAGVRQAVFVGALDDTAPPPVSLADARRARAAGDGVALTDTEEIAPGTAAWIVIAAKIVELAT